MGLERRGSYGSALCKDIGKETRKLDEYCGVVERGRNYLDAL
jgi:hypothetical protein